MFQPSIRRQKISRQTIRKASALFLACLSLAALIVAQSKQKTKATAATAFEITTPNYAYPQTIASMLEFDTKNATLALFDSLGKPATTAKFQNGVFEDRQKDGGYTNIRFTDYHYFEYFNQQPNHSLASMIWSTVGANTSSTTSVGLLQVFEVRDGHPVVTQQIRYNRLGDLTGASFNPDTLALTVKANRWSDHGTVAEIEVGKFRWDGKKFVLQPSTMHK